MMGGLLFDFDGRDVYGVIFLVLTLAALGVVIWTIFTKR